MEHTKIYKENPEITNIIASATIKDLDNIYIGEFKDGGIIMVTNKKAYTFKSLKKCVEFLSIYINEIESAIENWAEQLAKKDPKETLAKG
jgi:chaperonin cofactor prefoldin